MKLNKIREYLWPASKSSQSDSKEVQGEDKFDLEAIAHEPSVLEPSDLEGIELEMQKARLKAEKQNIQARQNYIPRIFWLAIVCVALLYGLLIVTGLGRLDIADNVLIALTVGTTASALGLLHIVMKYLFHTSS